MDMTRRRFLTTVAVGGVGLCLPLNWFWKPKPEAAPELGRWEGVRFIETQPTMAVDSALRPEELRAVVRGLEQDMRSVVPVRLRRYVHAIHVPGNELDPMQTVAWVYHPGPWDDLVEYNYQRKLYIPKHHLRRRRM